MIGEASCRSLPSLGEPQMQVAAINLSAATGKDIFRSKSGDDGVLWNPGVTALRSRQDSTSLVCHRCDPRRVRAGAAPGDDPCLARSQLYEGTRWVETELLDQGCGGWIAQVRGKQRSGGNVGGECRPSASARIAWRYRYRSIEAVPPAARCCEGRSGSQYRLNVRGCCAMPSSQRASSMPATCNIWRCSGCPRSCLFAPGAAVLFVWPVDPAVQALRHSSSAPP